MPPDASSRPSIGLKRTETSTPAQGPAGATMTLKAFFVARCTSARPWAASLIGSIAHMPVTVCQPSSGLVESKRCSDAARSWVGRATSPTPSAADPATSARRERRIASALRVVYFVERGAQALGELQRVVVRPEMHEEEPRLIVEHV